MALPSLTALAPITTAATSLSNLVLVSPQSTIGYQPQNPSDPNSTARPPAMLFHYEGEQTVAIESDITDHFIEDNTAIQDQISLKPEMITTHGFIGELNDIAPPALAILQAASQKLTTIGAYTPTLTTTALIAYNEAFLLYQVAANAVNSLVSAWGTISGTGGESVIDSAGINVQSNQNRQQVAFQQFYGYWRARTLFTVQTPWAVFQNMAIKNLRAIQDAETRVITDFEITFKMIRTAETATSLPTGQQGRAVAQSSGLVDLGTSTPVSSISLTQGLTNMGVQ